ncbi:hypothetical protein JTE90_011485 [Oedothorax gibbosus]|uniref:Paramyosin n=1 Tax=Oedothorax gibbosus TaxID=931172 RepID=A0AAV6VDB0_9ARAC|nr:hypothetical protein JTE90_011485 [Oedothorax gibbosus]
MAPKGVSNWKRPYTSIYNDNYKYGTGLYSDTLGDIEKRYSESLSKTQLRSDRPDLAFTTFAGSNLASSPTPGADRTTPTTPILPSFESRLNSALYSPYELDEQVQEAISSRAEQRRHKAEASRKAAVTEDLLTTSMGDRNRPKSLCLYDEWSLPRPHKVAIEEPEVPKRKTTSNGPSASGWREKSRHYQDQLETLEGNMSSVGNKLQAELSSLKNKYQGEIADLNRSVDVTSQQASDLQKLCKRQANQLLELQSAYEDSQRNVSDALEEVQLWQNKCRCIKKEMDRLREEVELAVQKTSRA